MLWNLYNGNCANGHTIPPGVASNRSCVRWQQERPEGEHRLKTDHHKSWMQRDLSIERISYGGGEDRFRNLCLLLRAWETSQYKYRCICASSGVYVHTTPWAQPGCFASAFSKHSYPFFSSRKSSARVTHFESSQALSQINVVVYLSIVGVWLITAEYMTGKPTDWEKAPFYSNVLSFQYLRKGELRKAGSDNKSVGLLWNDSPWATVSGM